MDCFAALAMTDSFSAVIATTVIARSEATKQSIGSTDEDGLLRLRLAMTSSLGAKLDCLAEPAYPR